MKKFLLVPLFMLLGYLGYSQTTNLTVINLSPYNLLLGAASAESCFGSVEQTNAVVVPSTVTVTLPAPVPGNPGYFWRYVKTEAIGPGTIITPFPNNGAFGFFDQCGNSQSSGINAIWQNPSTIVIF